MLMPRARHRLMSKRHKRRVAFQDQWASEHRWEDGLGVDLVMMNDGIRVVSKGVSERNGNVHE